MVYNFLDIILLFLLLFNTKGGQIFELATGYKMQAAAAQMEGVFLVKPHVTKSSWGRSLPHACCKLHSGSQIVNFSCQFVTGEYRKVCVHTHVITTESSPSASCPMFLVCGRRASTSLFGVIKVAPTVSSHCHSFRALRRQPALIGWRMQTSSSWFGNLKGGTSSLRNAAAPPAKNSDFQGKGEKKDSGRKTVRQAAGGTVLFQLWRSVEKSFDSRWGGRQKDKLKMCIVVKVQANRQIKKKTLLLFSFFALNVIISAVALYCAPSFWNVILSFLCLSGDFVLRFTFQFEACVVLFTGSREECSTCFSLSCDANVVLFVLFFFFRAD